MGFDYAQFYTDLETEFRKSDKFEQSMNALCGLLEKRLPHQDWDQIKSLELNEDLQTAKRWLPDVVNKAPCPFAPKALYFGLSEFMDEIDDEENDSVSLFYANLYLVQFGEYEPNDRELQWVYGNDRHDIDDSQADLEALKKAGIIFTGAKGIGYDAYLAYSVAFAVLLLRHLLDRNAFALFNSDTALGVATGFGSGDIFFLGELTAKGLIPSSRSLC